VTQKGHPFPASGTFMLDNPVRRWLQPPLDLVSKIAIDKGDIVVDFGCGPAYYTIEIAKKAKSVYAIDLSTEMLEKARSKAVKAKIENIQFLQSDGRNIDLPENSVDKILLVTVFHEIGDTELVLKEFSRIMKPNARLIIAEVIKTSVVPGAPVQDPKMIKSEVESNNFGLEKMLPYKNFGLFFFKKTNI
jgi:ubiquinone/menaquinone biosynthesis C-methylase UbiE